MNDGWHSATNGQTHTGPGPSGRFAPAPPLDLERRIEAIVRDVLATMFAQADAGPTPPPGTADIFAGRLLGLRDAELVPSGTRELSVAPGTVVTPMARDHLKRQGVTIRWASRGELVEAGLRGEWGFVIEDRDGAGASLRRTLLDQERDVWRDLGADPFDAIGWVADRPHRGAVVVTPVPSVAVWRACQVPHVRAAGANEPEAVRRACRQLGANLLVIEAIGLSIYSMKQLCATFRQAGVPQVPAGLKMTPSDAGHSPSRAGGHP